MGGQTSSALKSALASQPVSVTVNAGQLQFASHGVVTGPCRGQINHAVIAVGYGTDGQDYFKIRNSWGASWGEAGYIRLAQNSPSSQGTACLLQYNPVVPTLSSSPTPTPTPGCVDLDDASDCSYWKSAGYCSTSSQYYDYMKEHCCNSCGFGAELLV